MFTLWFMGRPAAGKTTLASRVADRLRAAGYPVENLDGDEVRRHLHPDLGFSRAERRTNNRRTAYLAAVLNRNDVPVVVGMIAPFREARERARRLVEEEGDGEFVLVSVECSLETAEARDPKGLYERARAGEIAKFTGIDHPFQEPRDPDVAVDTETLSVAESVEHVLTRLRDLGVVEGVATGE